MPGFLIEDWMMNERLGLKGNDLLIYALIYSFTRKGGTMFESEASLSVKFGLSRKQVGKILRKLTDDGFVIRSDSKHSGLQSYDYMTNIDKVLPFVTPRCEQSSHLKGKVGTKVTPRCEESSHPDGNKVHSEMGRKVTAGCEQSSHNNIIDNNKDNTNDIVVFPPSQQDLENELLPVFFFRNDCNPRPEFERFCEYYRQNGWKLSGGDILDTVEKRKRAAGNWRVQNPISPSPYPKAFMKAWKEIYSKAPDHLKDDIIRIRYICKTQFSITISCSQQLKEWMDISEEHEKIRLIFQIHAGEKYRFEYQSSQ